MGGVVVPTTGKTQKLIGKRLLYFVPSFQSEECDLSPDRYTSFEIEKISAETHDSNVYRFKIPDNGHIRLTVGQHLVIRSVCGKDQHFRPPYSLGYKTHLFTPKVLIKSLRMSNTRTRLQWDFSVLRCCPWVRLASARMATVFSVECQKPLLQSLQTESTFHCTNGKLLFAFRSKLQRKLVTRQFTPIRCCRGYFDVVIKVRPVSLRGGGGAGKSSHWLPKRAFT